MKDFVLHQPSILEEDDDDDEDDFRSLNTYSTTSKAAAASSAEFEDLMARMKEMEVRLYGRSSNVNNNSKTNAFQSWYQVSLKKQLLEESNAYTTQLSELHTNLAQLNLQLADKQRQLDRLESAIASTRKEHVAMRSQLKDTRRKVQRLQEGEAVEDDDDDGSSSSFDDDDSDISETDAFLTDDPMTKALLQMGHKLKEEKQRRQQQRVE